MNQIIEKYSHIIVQIAAAKGNGTGFYLAEYNLVITNYHVVSENSDVTISGKHIPQQRALVVYKDPLHDLAFIKATNILADIPTANLIPDSYVPQEGEPIIAIGHPYGLKYSATKGIVSKVKRQHGGLQYLQIDAAINPGNSGGPLINQAGEILGVNTFIIEGGDNLGFALPARYLHQSLLDYTTTYNDKRVERCSSCENLVEKSEADAAKGYCPHCGQQLAFAAETNYEPIGAAKIIETIFAQLGKDPTLARRGPNVWTVWHGSANITTTYDETSGIIIADARLCRLPKNQIAAIYEFLLRENYQTQRLVFSVKEQYIILSFIMFDRYLTTQNMHHSFEQLIEKADHYDNLLVENFGAIWAEPEEE
jgi:serine protease Do